MAGACRTCRRGRMARFTTSRMPSGPGVSWKASTSPRSPESRPGNDMKMIQKASAVALGLGLAATCLLLAQNTGIQRTVVKKADVSVPGREAVIARVEIAPSASAGRHTHPGDEISYVTEGEGEILME